MNDLIIYAKTIDGATINQIYTLASEISFQGQKIRIMPDAHAGLGAVVGFTSTLSDKIIPNVIGVDIGCGMRIYDLGAAEIEYDKLDSFIKTNIPSGSNVRREHRGAEYIKKLLCYNELKDMDRLLGSLGTLGGGNHFIEIDVSQNGKKYLVIHTGSRNLGTQVAKIYQKIAIHSCKNAANDDKLLAIEKLKSEHRQEEIPEKLKELSKKYSYKTKIPDELCYLEGYEAEKYLHDMKICQNFAKANRERIGQDILRFLKIHRADYFESIHNFIGDDNVIRKGAIPAYKGEKVLIPMNMRDGCIIGEGLGNPQWNYSAPHGAGRLMSRAEAKKNLSLDEYKNQMNGIYTTTVNASTIDESPMAYKPTDEIIQQISDTVRILEIIKPVYNFKASE